MNPPETKNPSSPIDKNGLRSRKVVVKLDTVETMAKFRVVDEQEQAQRRNRCEKEEEEELESQQRIIKTMVFDGSNKTNCPAAQPLLFSNRYPGISYDIIREAISILEQELPE